jgi:CoA:oxalate CoA-transferase
MSAAVEESLKPLDGLRVLDATGGVDGQYCGKLLAAAGARVTLLEPPGGSATRWRGPFLPGPAGPEQSLLFRHLNEGKRSALVDVSAVSGQRVLSRLLEQVDVFLHDGDLIGEVTVPDTVVDCTLRDFPSGGPYEGWLGTEMIHQALSGTMFVTGRMDHQPLYGVGQRAYYASGVTAYISVMAAVFERTTSGVGQRVEATVFESCAAMAQNLATQYVYSGTYPTRARYPGFLAVLQCQDGWVVLFALRNWDGFCRAFDAEALLEDPRFRKPADRLQNWPLVIEMLQATVADFTTEEVVKRAQQAKVNVEKVLSLRELVESEQWAIRGMVREFSEDGAQQYSLGPVFRLGDLGIAPRPGSPKLGADTAEVLHAADLSEEDQSASGTTRAP